MVPCIAPRQAHDSTRKHRDGRFAPDKDEGTDMPVKLLMGNEALGLCLLYTSDAADE